MSSGNRLEIVDDPEELYARSRIDHAARIEMFGRPPRTGTSSPMLLRQGQSRFQWELHDPQFQGAIPVLEKYGTAIKPNPGQPIFVLSVPVASNNEERDLCDIDPELSTKRLNFSDYFRFVVHLTGQTAVAGFSEEVLDLCDDPWLEWVHPAQNFASAFQPYRQYFQPQPPWQWQQTYWTSNWRIPYAQAETADTDTVNRAVSPNAFRGVAGQTFPSGPFPAVRVDIFQIEPTLGSITLTWSASPGAAGYRLYTNGVPAVGYMPAPQQKLTITGLALNTVYAYAIVAVSGTGQDASSLSNLVVYEHGTNEVMAIYALPWQNPGGFT